MTKSNEPGLPISESTSVALDVTVPVVLFGTEQDDVLRFYLDGVPNYSTSAEYLGAVITAYGGHDVLLGSHGGDAMNGGAGNDFFKGYYGNDSIDGWSDTDTVDYSYYGNHLPRRPGLPHSNLGVLVDLESGYSQGRRDFIVDNDTLTSIENVNGSGFADVLHGSSVANVISGGAGNDYIFGWNGDDKLDGGIGNDKISGGEGNDFITGGFGNDHLVGFAGVDTVNYLYAASGFVIDIFGGDASGGSADTDTLVDFENVVATNFNDTVEGNANNNRIEGAAGDDWLQGFYGEDRLFGGAGNDALSGGDSADELVGGAGRDVAEYSNSAEGVTVNLALGTGKDGEAEGDTLGEIENLAGSGLDDTLIGNGANNQFFGQDGSDLLRGGASNDQLFGGNGQDVLVGEGGNDSLIGEAGADQLSGGNGIDSVSYGGSAVGVTIDLAAGVAQGGDADGDTLSSIENVFGSALEDTLTGDGQNNLLHGSVGDDAIDGGGGHDHLEGEDGVDTMSGRDGNDMMLGGWGNDRMNGGTGEDYIFGDRGRDQIAGGGGGDSFVYRSILDSKIAAAERDVISDFQQGSDVLDLAGIDAVPSTVFDNAFNFIGEAAFTGNPGQLRYRAVNGNTLVEADVDGDTNADFAVLLTGAFVLAANDFVL